MKGYFEDVRILRLDKLESMHGMNRTIGVWTDEGTGDIGNRGIAQPRKPENVKKINEMENSFSEDRLTGLS